jgi:hypothetical protein
MGASGFDPMAGLFALDRLGEGVRLFTFWWRQGRSSGLSLTGQLREKLVERAPLCRLRGRSQVRAPRCCSAEMALPLGGGPALFSMRRHDGRR